MADVLMNSDVLELPHGTLAATRMSKDEVRLELAVMFYSSGRLSFGKARQLAGVDHLQFRHELAARGVAVQLEPHDIDSDLASIEAALQA
jgi:predicted HTH domain antitoxin